MYGYDNMMMLYGGEWVQPTWTMMFAASDTHHRLYSFMRNSYPGVVIDKMAKYFYTTLLDKKLWNVR